MPLALRRALWPLVLATGLCCVFVALRSQYAPPLGDGVDGAYYFQMARQVALGAGLRTSYSVFHMALAPLPQRATSYPLLPTAIGGLSHFMPLERAAVWLPGAAYVLSIVLCFGFLAWTTERSLARCPRSTRLALSAFLAAWFGLIPVYVWTSARPYTETVANSILLACLWAFGWSSTARFRSRSRRSLAFFGIGVLAGLCYLARFQLIAVPVALLIARALSRDRRRSRDLVWLALGVGPCVGLQAVRLLTMPNAEPYALLDFAMYRQLPDVPRFVYDMQFDSRLEWWLDKLHGLRLSYDSDNDESYFVQLSYLIWLVPLGIAGFAVKRSWQARKLGFRALGLGGVRRPRHAALLASVWVGLLAVAPIHTVHSLHWRTWSFAWRHGMPLLYVILPSAIWLWAQGRGALRLLVALLLALSLVMCGQKTLEVLERRVPTQMLRAYQEVAVYLDSSSPTRGTLGMEHQSLAVFTAEPLYWLACWSPPELASIVVRKLAVDRLLLRPGELRCHSLDQIRRLLRPERTFTAHYPMTLYRIER